MEPKKEGMALEEWCEKRERRREAQDWEETKVMSLSLCLCPPLFFSFFYVFVLLFFSFFDVFVLHFLVFVMSLSSHF